MAKSQANETLVRHMMALLSQLDNVNEVGDTFASFVAQVVVSNNSPREFWTTMKTHMDKLIDERYPVQ